MKIRVVGFAVTLCSAGLLAAPAIAHAHLEKASPSEKSTVTAAPDEINLTFSEGVNLAFTGATVTGPDKSGVSLGKAHFAAGSDQTLIVPVKETLKPGRYVVDWHALSRDGHKTHGSYTFTVGH